jgi:hypothetical protein
MCPMRAHKILGFSAYRSVSFSWYFKGGNVGKHHMDYEQRGNLPHSSLLLLLLLLFIYLFKLKMSFYLVAVVLQKTQHTNNTHHTPHSKHSIQNYTNNKGHTTHNEYNANTITTTIK